MDLFERMLGHDRWATERILDYSRELTDEQLDQQFDIGRQSLRETLDHMILVVDFWTVQMAGQPAPSRRLEGRRSVAELAERHARHHAAFADLARRARAAGRLDETFLDHYTYPQSLGATIIQVLHHNAQHRAEARHILERLGVSVRGDLDPQEWEHATGRISSASR